MDSIEASIEAGEWTLIFEMSELCNNSACFSVEIKDASDICVTFVVYACGKSIKKHLPPQRGKEKNR